MNLQLMYNRQLQKSKHSAKALDNSKASVNTCFCTYILIPRLCGLFSFHVVWKQHYSCADPYKVHTEIPEYGGGPTQQVQTFHIHHNCTNFVLDARILVWPANVIERQFLACQHLTITAILGKAHIFITIKRIFESVGLQNGISTI